MKYHVAAIDDEKIALDGLVHLDWEGAGFELAATLSSGAAALKWLQHNSCDLIIADIRMPGISGLELAAKVRETQPDIIVVLLSGHSEFEYAREAVRRDVFRYILKPIDDEEIAEVLAEVRSHLDERESRRHWTQKIVRDYWFRDHLRQKFDPEHFDRFGKDFFPSEQIGPHRVAYVVGHGDVPKQQPFAQSLYHSTYLQNHQWVWIVLERYMHQITDVLPDTVRCIGLSATKTSLHDMRTGLTEARRAADEWFKRPSERVYWYTPEPPDIETRLHRSLNHAAELADRISMLHVDEPVAETQRFLSSLETCPFDSTSVRRIAYTVALGIQRLLNRYVSGQETAPMDVLPDPFAIIEHGRHLHEITRDLSVAVDKAVTFVQNSRRQESTDDRLAAVREFIQEHFRDPISLDDVAAEAGMHPARFSTWFKEAQGINYIDYLTRLRVETAKSLLRDPRVFVKDVARKSGFQDPRYFGQVFKKHVGITPTRYQFLHGRETGSSGNTP